MNETVEKLRREYFVAHNEVEQARVNVARLSSKLDEISGAASSGRETTREIYNALSSATDAARQLLDILVERRRAAASKFISACYAAGIVPTL